MTEENIILCGIDPGLVDTGVVVLTIYRKTRTIYRNHDVVSGSKPDSTPLLIENYLDLFSGPLDHMYIEKYDQRGQSWSTNPDMMQLESGLRGTFPKAEFISNRGSRQVVTDEIMDVFGCLNFPTTNHQDLQAAARILLWGMVKNPDLNEFAYDIVYDFVRGFPWRTVEL